jgi:5'-3' exonuclease
MSVAATEAPPEIDNLYLDMNGIIHNCTHANDPNLKLTETEMVVRIFTYLDKLIQIIKPQKLVFMAIDGAGPLVGCDSPLSCVLRAGHRMPVLATAWLAS